MKVFIVDEEVPERGAKRSHILLNEVLMLEWMKEMVVSPIPRDRDNFSWKCRSESEFISHKQRCLSEHGSQFLPGTNATISFRRRCHLCGWR